MAYLNKTNPVNRAQSGSSIRSVIESGNIDETRRYPKCAQKRQMINDPARPMAQKIAIGMIPAHTSDLLTWPPFACDALGRFNPDSSLVKRISGMQNSEK